MSVSVQSQQLWATLRQRWQQVRVSETEKLLQCSHRCANVTPALTALSRHWRDASGTDSTRECDNSVAGPTLLALASCHSPTCHDPRWSVSDNSQNMSRIHINTYK